MSRFVLVTCLFAVPGCGGEATTNAPRPVPSSIAVAPPSAEFAGALSPPQTRAEPRTRTPKTPPPGPGPMAPPTAPPGHPTDM